MNKCKEIVNKMKNSLSNITHYKYSLDDFQNMLNLFSSTNSLSDKNNSIDTKIVYIIKKIFKSCVYIPNVKDFEKHVNLIDSLYKLNP